VGVGGAVKERLEGSCRRRRAVDVVRQGEHKAGVAKLPVALVPPRLVPRHERCCVGVGHECRRGLVVDHVLSLVVVSV